MVYLRPKLRLDRTPSRPRFLLLSRKRVRLVRNRSQDIDTIIRGDYSDMLSRGRCGWKILAAVGSLRKCSKGLTRQRLGGVSPVSPRPALARECRYGFRINMSSRRAWEGKSLQDAGTRCKVQRVVGGGGGMQRGGSGSLLPGPFHLLSVRFSVHLQAVVSLVFALKK